MNEETRKAIEQEAVLNISNFIKNKGEVFFEITKDDNGYNLVNKNLKYRIEKNEGNYYGDTYGLIVFKDDEEIKFHRRPFENGDYYDEFAILISGILKK